MAPNLPQHRAFWCVGSLLLGIKFLSLLKLYPSGGSPTRLQVLSHLAAEQASAQESRLLSAFQTEGRAGLWYPGASTLRARPSLLSAPDIQCPLLQAGPLILAER